MNLFKRKSHIILTLIVIFSVTILIIRRNRSKSTSEDINVNNNIKNIGTYQYIKSPKCFDTRIIWLITSYAGNSEKRRALRTTYAQEELQTLGIQRFFLLGQLPEKQNSQQHNIDIESSIHHDIVQGQFLEAYKNLTYKHLMGLNWISQYCKPNSYVIKMDDDIVINIYDLLPKIRRKEENFLMGYALKKFSPKRDPANKWFITRKEFEKDIFPDFVSGWLYVTNVKTAEKLIQQSRKYERFFWIDDVFVTGILREELDIIIIDIHESYATDYRFLECCIKGMINNSKCEYIAGPDGAQYDLLYRFQKYAKYCSNNNCTLHTVGNTCVTVYEEKLVQGTGRATVQIIQN